jgi:hypothetical protein
MHIVVVMSLFVVLADIIDDLHVLIVISFEGVSACELHAEGMLQYKSDVFATLG